MKIEERGLGDLQHYYGANPYDTFQVGRALDAAGLKTDAEALLRHPVKHLKDDHEPEPFFQEIRREWFPYGTNTSGPIASCRVIQG